VMIVMVRMAIVFFMFICFYFSFREEASVSSRLSDG